MKLQSIDLSNYLSHPGTRFELNGARLAVIVGDNGAGKSALLEALKYSLFDDARAKTDQLVRLGQTEMSATIEFDFGGQRYRAVRGRSTRGAGKTYLELAVLGNDGTWISLSGDDIRSTQAAIEELLGLDAATFATAVYLGQGEADRFAAATAGDRKRILSQVLGLEVYGRAEAKAREEARDLEARSASERSNLERLITTIGELAAAPGQVVAITDMIHAVARDQTAAAAERDGIQARRTELAGEIAKGDAAAAEVARLEADREVLADRYRRERDARQRALEAIAGAGQTLVDVDAVIQAADELPVAQGAVTELERLDLAFGSLVDEVRQQREKVLGLERDWERLYEPWRLRYVAAQERVGELVEHGKAGTSVCVTCGQSIDRDQALEQLAGARRSVAEIEAAEPKQPLTIARESATHERLETRLREMGEPDPDVLSAARRRLLELERLAARQEAMTAAETARTTAVAAKTSADAELAAIEEAGKALATRITEAIAKTAGTAALMDEDRALLVNLTSTTERIRQLEGDRHTYERNLATAQERVARLEALTVDRDVVTARLAEADVDLARLRRLVAAFGVTGIPARIIEGVLPELTGYANELLGELRPGMVLEIRAQRAKRDGKGVVEALDLIVCDDAGERPLGLFSGGERMSVSLAIATALSRLVARRAGAAIRTLVIDEPDGLDADARRAFGQALRILAHHGELERVVLVSHHPDLAEYGDAVFQVTKSGAGSVVEQVA